MNVSLERKCGLSIPSMYKGMDIAWPYQKRELGDRIMYSCPNGHLTWDHELSGIGNFKHIKVLECLSLSSRGELYLAQTK